MHSYSFNYRVKPGDLTILSLARIYRSLPGVVNVIFTISLVLLSYRFWEEVNTLTRAAMLFGASLFPLVQPLIIAMRSSQIVKALPQDMQIELSDEALVIHSGDTTAQVPYRDLRSVQRTAGMLVISSVKKNTYILHRRQTQGRLEEVHQFIQERFSAKT